MRIAIMGSGGTGGFLGAKLARAGHDVIFIARGAHLRAIQAQGLMLLSKDGNIHINPATAYDNTQQVTPVDLILFCVKLYDTDQAARDCLPLMQGNTFILTVQNGVQSVDLISDIVGQGRTIGGSIYVSANIQSPGIITHSGGNNTIHFAQSDNQPSARTEILEQAFKEAGLIGLRADDMRVMLWSKFVLLCANAALGTLADCGATQLCKDPDTMALFSQAMNEVYHVAEAMGIVLPKDIIENNINFILSMPPENDLIASQCLDFRQGKKLELDWVQGTLHRLGQQYGVPTPINSTAYVALRRFACGSFGQPR